jgi:glyceraldehyde-3-phosphate dehydrogenase/erythrose-4-phosphate dehydrogenase
LLHLSGVVIQALDAVRVPVTTVTLHDVTAQLDLKAEYQRVKVRTREL